ncbi:hypothetical protein Tco_1018785 [Tanacetum coccineum]|uniref:RNA-directed DNA polymerase, eukaryota, reverse transcriptase zinc-binding domain protein n=1 Tax=Tanacetum coccineum TaxID=301880 RepID=A0ABQ5FWT6_9ASTR
MCSSGFGMAHIEAKSGNGHEFFKVFRYGVCFLSDTTYRVGFLGVHEGIRCIWNWSNAFSCEVLALIRRISFVVYGVLVRNQHSSNIFVLAQNYAPFSLSSQNTPELLHLSTLKQLSTGIVVGWDPHVVKIMLYSQTSQLMIVFVEAINGNQKFFCTFIYGHYKECGRKCLWKDLIMHGLVVKDAPWVFLRTLLSSLTQVKDLLNTLVFLMEKEIPSYAMFSLASKLKLLKKPLRKLKFDQGDLAEKVQTLKAKLCNIQEKLVKDPFNIDLRIEEVNALYAFNSAIKDEELFLKQRSKITWLSEGALNTKYFHNAMKKRRNKGRIKYVEDLNGNSFSGSNVGDQFVKNFENVLVEIEALFSMSDDKSPGPDGFYAKFFKASWFVLGFEFSHAILDFFAFGKLLKEINSTVIALLPKSHTPKKSLILDPYLVVM